MSFLDSQLRQGGQYVRYNFNTDRTSSTVSSYFYCTESRTFCKFDDRMDFVYGSVNHNRHPAFHQSSKQIRSWCVSSFPAWCTLEHGNILGDSYKKTDLYVLPKYNYNTGYGQHTASPQRKKNQCSRIFVHVSMSISNPPYCTSDLLSIALTFLNTSYTKYLR